MKLPEHRETLQLNRHLKGMFGNPIAIVFGIFRSCMFAERKTSILLKKISLTCKYE